MTRKIRPNSTSVYLLFAITFVISLWCKASLQRLESHQKHCNLQKDMGPCRNFTVLWYYDSAGAICSRFWYGGCRGNSNRFATQEECQSTCIPSNDEEDGARSQQNPCLMRPELSAGPCTNFSIKWMYDVSGAACRQFYYGGCKGNLNRFDTEAECQTRCLGNTRVRGQYSTTPTASPTTPTASKPTRAHHSTKECHLRYETGPCRNFTVKWTYDSHMKSCKQFYYGGCQGNNNRYESVTDCQKACVSVEQSTTPQPRSQSLRPQHGETGGRNAVRWETGDVCELKMETGRCRDYTIKWTYDTHTQSCRRFYYGGCGGNGNRFNTEEECRKDCPKRKLHQRRQDNTKQHHANVVGTLCKLPVRSGSCNEVHLRYYYNPNRDRCQPFKYTGCDGNNNNFLSRAACDRKCGSFRDQDVCNMTPAPGSCHLSIPMFYYDFSTKNCEKFNFSGCQGNGNTFFAYRECMEYCSATSKMEVSTPAITLTTSKFEPSTGPMTTGQDVEGAKYMHFMMLRGSESTRPTLGDRQSYHQNYNSNTTGISSAESQEDDHYSNYNVIS